MVAERLGITDPEPMSMVIWYVAFYVMNYMQKDGISENGIVIMDLEHAIPWNLPVRAMK